MPIRFACPCGKQLQVKDEHAGKVVKCPACARGLRVPAAAVTTAPGPAPAPARKRLKPLTTGSPDSVKHALSSPARARGDAPSSYRFSFTGTGGAFLARMFVGLLLTLITFGIYLPWFICGVRAWVTENVRLSGGGNTYRFRFTGTGGELFVTYLVGFFLTMITLGIYMPWFVVKLLRFFVENTTGRTPEDQKINLKLNLTGGQLFAKLLVGYLLTFVTLGIYSPWFLCSMFRLLWENFLITVDGEKVASFRFEGTGGRLFGILILGYILTGITVGIYLAWFIVKLLGFLYEETAVSTPAGRRFQLRFAGTGGQLFVVFLLRVFLVPLTFGIYYFWNEVALKRFYFENVQIEAA